MPKTFSVLLAVVLAVPLAACGGDDSGGSGGSGGAAASPSPSPSPSLNKAEAERIAQSTLLTATDVPGFTGEGDAGENPQEEAYDKMLTDCVGLEPMATRVLAHAETVGFSRAQPDGQVTVASETNVVKDPATAQADVAKLAGDKAPQCLKATLSKVLKDQSLQVTALKVTPIQLGSVPGAEGVFAYRADGKVKAGGATLGLSSDFVGAAVGAAELGLTTVGVGKPVPAAERDRLLGLLVQRAVDAQKQ